jgi:hypothetical protein
MTLMDPVLQTLLFYVRFALAGRVCTFPIEDPDRFFRMSRQQGFSGLLYSALSDEADPNLRRRFQADYYRYLTVDANQQEAIGVIRIAFGSQNIPHIFLKGAYLKRLYPYPYIRSMGDIDVLVPSEHQNSAGKTLQAIGYTLISEGPTHDQYEKGKVHVEVHPQVDRHFDPLHQKALEGLWDRAIPEESMGYRLEVIDLGIYLLAHLAKHFRFSGIGMRQILDIGMWENHIRETVSLDLLKNRLETAGLWRFFLTLSWLNQRWFEISPLFSEPACDLGREDLEEIETFLLASGVHGKAEGFNTTLPRVSSEARNHPSGKHPQARVFFRSVFPKREDLVFTYRYLEKHPGLLPWAWISRWFRLLFLQPRRTWKKIREFRIPDREVSEKAALFQKIGL